MEILNYLQDAAGSRNLVFDLAVTHDRYGSSAQPHHNGLLTHPQDLDAPLHVAARKKINAYRDQYANNRVRCGNVWWLSDRQILGDGGGWLCRLHSVRGR